MKEVQQKLMACYLGLIGIAVLLVVLGETDVMILPSMSGSAEFVAQIIMELCTIIVIPLSLKLFSVKRVHNMLVEKKEKALIKWGLFRMNLLLFPMLIDILFYYQTMSPAFGYMAIILFLSLFFVNPSKGRCKDDVK
jgi:hypothetical protein